MIGSAQVLTECRPREFFLEMLQRSGSQGVNRIPDAQRDRGTEGRVQPGFKRQRYTGPRNKPMKLRLVTTSPVPRGLWPSRVPPTAPPGGHPPHPSSPFYPVKDLQREVHGALSWHHQERFRRPHLWNRPYGRMQDRAGGHRSQRTPGITPHKQHTHSEPRRFRPKSQLPH